MADKVHQGRVLPDTSNAVTAQQGLDALQQIVEGLRECVTTHQVETTKRTRIQAYETTEVAKIKAAEDVLHAYFERAFAERRDLFHGLFERLDRALDSGDSESLGVVARSLVDVAKSSPISDIGDLGQIRAALDDPNQVWDL